MDIVNASMVSSNPGGKGRTGSFCSSLMLWTGLFSTAAESLAYFARRRTDPSVGKHFSPIAVTSPSQRRFVHYLGQVIADLGCAAAS